MMLASLQHITMDTTSMLQRTLIVEAAPAPPDGGWGWVVVLAGFVCHLVIDGIVYSSGIFFDEFLAYFGEGYAATSWISSITFGCYLISSKCQIPRSRNRTKSQLQMQCDTILR